MRYSKIGLVCGALFASGAFTNVQAQSVSVDINRAKLSWTWAQGTGGLASEFRVKCGQTSGAYTNTTVVPYPTLTINVKDAITGNGNWFCAVTAANSFGESGASNEVPFVAGAAPSNSPVLSIQAQ